MLRPVTLAVDAAGGYNAPEQVVAAVAEASLKQDRWRPVYFTLVGDERELTELLSAHNHNSERIHIAHASERIGMAERAATAQSTKPQASINIACQLVQDGEADAVITAGNPGAAVLSATEHFGLLAGVHKAALAAVYPTPRSRGTTQDPFSLLLDVGATLQADADALVHFALMGTAYARIISQNPYPTVALLSNSHESTTGPPQIVEAYNRLSELKGLNFYGHIEGNQIPGGLADVIVCDGFTGDVAIKILEGVTNAAFELARSAYDKKLLWRFGLKLLSGGLQQLKQFTDFDQYAGAPLLGVNNVMILVHPRSQRNTFLNAFKVATKSVRAELPKTIAALIEQSAH